MERADLGLQLDWDVSKLHGRWRRGLDNLFLLKRLATVTAETTAEGSAGRVLEVAAGEAMHSARLSRRGLRSYAVEPSSRMLERARRRVVEHNACVTFVRGVAETLPFRDRTFDRVLCDSAIDHLANPDVGIREMARVLKPDGRLIIGVVNYGGLSVRVSRLVYRLGRLLRVAPSDRHFFWDSPVPIEHTFECTYSLLRRSCAPYLDLERAFGVSIGWMVPGWDIFLRRLPARRAVALLEQLDRLAYARPRIADFVVSVWRRRARLPRARPGAQGDWPVVRPSDVVYAGKAKAEADYWAAASFGTGYFRLLHAADRDVNRVHTGDPDRSWLTDLIGRGPFFHAAVLGCDEGGYEAAWVRCRASRRLDVYELSPGVIRKIRRDLAPGLRRLALPAQGIRFIRADLNLVRLPRGRYDVIWSSGCLHHIVELEHLFAEVERALRPRGLFAIHDYVGERRLQYAPERLARINEVLQQVPARFRRLEAITPPSVEELSPFCGVRSDDILPLARERFDVVHWAVAGALFPLSLAVDLAAIEQETPETSTFLRRAEEAACRDPSLRRCGAYAVLRKRQ